MDQTNTQNEEIAMNGSSRLATEKRGCLSAVSSKDTSGDTAAEAVTNQPAGPTNWHDSTIQAELRQMLDNRTKEWNAQKIQSKDERYASKKDPYQGWQNVWDTFGGAGKGKPDKEFGGNAWTGNTNQKLFTPELSPRQKDTIRRTFIIRRAPYGTSSVSLIETLKSQFDGTFTNGIQAELDSVTTDKFDRRRHYLTFHRYESKRIVAAKGFRIGSTVIPGQSGDVSGFINDVPYYMNTDDLRTLLKPYGDILTDSFRTYKDTGIKLGGYDFTMNLHPDKTLPDKLTYIGVDLDITDKNKRKRCNYCHNFGHLQSYCRQKQKQVQARQPQAELATNINLTNDDPTLNTTDNVNTETVQTTTVTETYLPPILETVTTQKADGAVNDDANEDAKVDMVVNDGKADVVANDVKAEVARNDGNDDDGDDAAQDGYVTTRVDTSEDECDHDSADRMSTDEELADDEWQDVDETVRHNMGDNMATLRKRASEHEGEKKKKRKKKQKNSKPEAQDEDWKDEVERLKETEYESDGEVVEIKKKEEPKMDIEKECEKLQKAMTYRPCYADKTYTLHSTQPIDDKPYIKQGWTTKHKHPSLEIPLHKIINNVSFPEPEHTPLMTYTKLLVEEAENMLSLFDEFKFEHVIRLSPCRTRINFTMTNVFENVRLRQLQLKCFIGVIDGISEKGKFLS